MAVDLESDDDAPMDEEPEVDELDSDPEPVSSKKNAPTRVQGQRTPGTTLLPMQRLETMIQADGACRFPTKPLPRLIACRYNRPSGYLQRGLMDAGCLYGEYIDSLVPVLL